MVIIGHNGVHQSNKNDADVKVIYIHETNTKYMPESLGTLFNLTYFGCVNSQLVEINAEMFEGMDNLEGLYLYRNKLTSVSLNAFMKLTKLKYISLSYNQIEELPNGLFKDNVNLETIGLSGNKLKFIGSTLFDGLTKLNDVWLQNNVCINKRYEGSTTITQMRKDIKSKCFNPNEVPAVPTSTTPNPLKVKQLECEEKKSNLTIELNIAKEDLNEVKMNLTTALNAQQKDLLEMIKVKTNSIKLQDELNECTLKSLDDVLKEQMKFITLAKQCDLAKEQMNYTQQELSNAKEQHERESIECNLKIKKLSEKVSTFDQIGNEKLLVELKQVKDKQQKKGTEMNQQHNKMTDKINELKTKQQQELLKLNQQLTQMTKKMDKLMQVMAEQQTERAENAAMKIELNETKTHQQNQQNELEKERLQLKELNRKNSELQRKTFDANKEIFDLKEERRMERMAMVEMRTKLKNCGENSTIY